MQLTISSFSEYKEEVANFMTLSVPVYHIHVQFLQDLRGYHFKTLTEISWIAAGTELTPPVSGGIETTTRDKATGQGIM